MKEKPCRKCKGTRRIIIVDGPHEQGTRLIACECAGKDKIPGTKETKK